MIMVKVSNIYKKPVINRNLTQDFMHYFTKAFKVKIVHSKLHITVSSIYDCQFHCDNGNIKYVLYVPYQKHVSLYSNRVFYIVE